MPRAIAHYSFGAVYQWMVENIGGIRNDGPGYQQIIIYPQLDNELRWAKTSYRCVHGKIETSWKRELGKYTLDVTIPPGSTAAVYLPAINPDIKESDKPAADAPGVTVMRAIGDRAYLTIGSGTYHFTSTVKLPTRN